VMLDTNGDCRCAGAGWDGCSPGFTAGGGDPPTTIENRFALSRESALSLLHNLAYSRTADEMERATAESLRLMVLDGRFVDAFAVAERSSLCGPLLMIRLADLCEVSERVVTERRTAAARAAVRAAATRPTPVPTPARFPRGIAAGIVGFASLAVGSAAFLTGALASIAVAGAFAAFVVASAGATLVGVAVIRRELPSKSGAMAANRSGALTGSGSSPAIPAGNLTVAVGSGRNGRAR
jgi:hypothetical protein